MSSMRTTITLDAEIAAEARALGVSLSASARAGIEQAVSAARAEVDRVGYQARPERADSFWGDAESWGEE